MTRLTIEHSVGDWMGVLNYDIMVLFDIYSCSEDGTRENIVDKILS